MNVENIKKKFIEEFNEEPILFRSPGRINLLGEHTDYNMGFVLPAAIDKEIIFAIQPVEGNFSNIISHDLNESLAFNISDIQFSKKHWANYLLGVIDQLNKHNKKIGAFNLVFGGDIPIGAGLSSSAAIEGGLVYALNHIFNLEIKKIDLVKIAQSAENDFVGVKCGIMDQYINIFGSENKALKIDCRSLEYEYIPLKFDGIKIVLLDTQIKHSLATSEYNLRREQCEEGIVFLRKNKPDIKYLRDVSIDYLNLFSEKMDKTIFKRCDYVVRENKRLTDGCRNLANNNIKAFGEKMFETHYGLRDDYEVSCKELDLLVSIAEKDNGVIGARMMGGGFGGCTINILKENYVNEFIECCTKIYKDDTGKKLKSYLCTIKNGTSLVNPI